MGFKRGRFLEEMLQNLKVGAARAPEGEGSCKHVKSPGDEPALSRDSGAEAPSTVICRWVWGLPIVTRKGSSSKTNRSRGEQADGVVEITPPCTPLGQELKGDT